MGVYEQVLKEGKPIPADSRSGSVRLAVTLDLKTEMP